MLNNKKIIVILPAYNAEKTVQKTIDEIDKKIVDEIIVVDDFSTDNTSKIVKELGLVLIKHKKNLGYGANQKTCYNEAIKRGADVIIMLHPDYQYTPKLIPAMAGMIASGIYDFVLASRILDGNAIKGGMPIYKYISNRILTYFQNICFGSNLSEFHSGYRAYNRKLLSSINYEKFDNGFIFDNQTIIKTLYLNFKIGEISCPTKYERNSSSINFFNSLFYGLKCIKYTILYLLKKTRLYSSKFFED